MTPAELQTYIAKTYFWLRGGLCALAFVFPPLLWGVGRWNGVPLQASMSAYYFAFAPEGSDLRVFPGRVVFVGILFVVGFFLGLYRGFSKTENAALNIAGLSALVVALFPTNSPLYCNNCGINEYPYVHGTAAAILFLCTAFVAWACSEETLVQLPEPLRRRFRIAYYALAITMVVAPVAVIVMTYKFDVSDKKIFFIEWVGIATFAAYWGLKCYELSLSNADEQAVKGEMSTVQMVPAGELSIRQRAARLLD
jgi:hypothetical protein